jgi:hypothetical protein
MNHQLKSKELMSRKYKSVLIISDQHHPYQHKDLVPFLKAIKQEHGGFDLVVNTGDEVDLHAFSFHEHDPDLAGPSDELKRAIEALQPLYSLFPNQEVIDSNHSSLVLRQGRAAGLPAGVFKDHGDILQAPKGWKWSKDLTFNTELGPVYVHHGKTSVASKLSKNMAMNTVQGHFHSRFQVDYWGSPNGLYWDMHVGCVVDDNSLAMAYNKTTLQRPVIGVGVVKNGRPLLVPMLLNSKGRWVGRL